MLQPRTKETYGWTFIAFLTAFCLNFLAMAFESRTIERQSCAIACFIQALAGAYSLMAFYEVAPVLEGPSGNAVPLLR